MLTCPPDPSFKNAGRNSCCGLIRTSTSLEAALTTLTDNILGTSSTKTIPYSDVLEAKVEGNEICVVHALHTSKKAVRPAYMTYPLTDKTTASTATAWASRLQASAYQGVKRLRKVKVLINPYGGQGLAPKLWAREAEPILKAAGCEVDAQTTTHHGHAQEIARDLDVDKYDAIICCSGDGCPHEVFNGLAQQEFPQKALRKIAIGLIPGGSGNAMAINVTNTLSASLAALAIVKASRTPLDLIAISQGDKRYLSFLSQSVGIVAESDLDTEDIRWMGSARFTYGFLVRLFGKTVYPAEVSVKLETDDKEKIRSSFKDSLSKKDAPNDVEAVDPREAHDNETELPKGHYGTVNDPIPNDWLTTDMPDLGNFFCGNMAYMSPDLPFFPVALPNDGMMDLVDIEGTVSRITAVKLMLSVETGAHFDQKDVHYQKVKAYRISPRLRPGQKQGFISIDGERVDFAPFQAEVLPGLGTVLSTAGNVFHCTGPAEPKR